MMLCARGSARPRTGSYRRATDGALLHARPAIHSGLRELERRPRLAGRWERDLVAARATGVQALANGAPAAHWNLPYRATGGTELRSTLEGGARQRSLLPSTATRLSQWLRGSARHRLVLRNRRQGRTIPTDRSKVRLVLRPSRAPRRTRQRRGGQGPHQQGRLRDLNDRDVSGTIGDCVPLPVLRTDFESRSGLGPR